METLKSCFLSRTSSRRCLLESVLEVELQHPPEALQLPLPLLQLLQQPRQRRRKSPRRSPTTTWDSAFSIESVVGCY
ncbi:unnamed protein product [Haemonchus placei]|uniref:Uncharacterized protein n=1 Tax=Haemonchus placei TaxID=6290 RepID=A0A3P7U9W0_HAEPC|nr:unnamed protein product [Haemonchus placei]